MLRLLLYGLAALHLGPGFAFAVLAFGCDPSAPALGTLCQARPLWPFVWLTLGAWAAMLAGFVAQRVVARHAAGRGAH